MYKIYILLCDDRLFYVGFSNDLKTRIYNHKKGYVRFTSSFKNIKLVYVEDFNSKEEALNREKQLKGWSRKKKINLIKFGHPNKNQ